MGSFFSDAEIAAMSREELIRHMSETISCIVRLENIQNEHDILEQELENIGKERDAIIGGNLRKQALGCGIWIVLWLYVAGNSFESYQYGRTIIFMLMSIAGVVALINFYKKHSQETEERQANAEAFYNKEAPPVTQRITENEQAAKAIIASKYYQMARSLIPDDYFDANSISQISRILQNRRANSLSDAINVYENELHQQRMEEAANRSAAAQERSANAQERTAYASEQQARYAKSTSRAAKLNTFINYLNYKKRAL